jgi:hypothetical protein
MFQMHFFHYAQILERAEKVNQADKESATDEFLAQFKTVNFRMDDMKGVCSTSSEDDAPR